MEVGWITPSCLRTIAKQRPSQHDTSEGWVAVHFTKQFILYLFVYAAGDCVLPNNNSNNLDETSAAAVVSGTTRP